MTSPIGAVRIPASEPETADVDRRAQRAIDAGLVVETRALTKQYGSRTVVDGLDMQVPAGVVAGFIGPNGAGKTTTLRMLLGLVRPSAGGGRILGLPLDAAPGYLPRVGALIESPAFYPGLSGERNLAVQATLGGCDLTRVPAVLERVGLAERGDDPYRTYSLGMKQRLGIAGALLGDPTLLILDEPTNGLDPAGIRDMRGLVRSLAEDGPTVLVSSHLLAEVQEVCDWLVVIEHGRRVFQGPTARLLAGGDKLILGCEHPAGLPQLQALLARRGVSSAIGGDRVHADLADVAAIQAAGGLTRLLAELLKLRRPAVLYGAGGAMLGFALLATILTFATAVTTPAVGPSPVGGASIASTVGQLGQADGLTRGFTIAAGFIGLLVFVLFTISMTSEYGLGTIRVLLIRQPSRARLLTGKLLALLACVAAVLLAAELLSGAAAIVLAHARGIPTADWLTAAGLRHAAGDYANAVLTATAFGAIGMMTGVLVRSTPIALGIGLAWLGPLEHIVQIGWSAAASWFPGLLIDAIATGGSTVTTYQRALLAALIYAALALTAGMVTFTRRDVSV